MKLRFREPLTFLATAALVATAFSATVSIDPKVYLDEVKYLSSPELKGRLTGSPELEKAAGYLSAKYESFGLAAVGGSYQQPFQVTTDARLGPHNRFSFTEHGHTVKLHWDEFVPFNFSQTGKMTGAVVFAGYGITAPEYHYDDYAGLDAKGKIVLILRHEPQESDPNSVFEGKSYTQHAQFASKASNAKMHGAIGVLLVMDRANHPDLSDELEKFGATAGPSNAGIPFVQVKEEKVDGWFADAGKRLADLQAGIDRDLKPRSFAFPDAIRVDAELDVERAVKTVHNVVAYRKGQTAEYVIIGGHYDHLGLGGQYSLAPSETGTIHPGADDNASGAAGVLELARWFSKQPDGKRGILFLNFAGEEEGLLGSAYYAEHPLLPLKDAVAMVNLDMIGRMRDGRVYLGGADTGTTLRAMVEKLVARRDVKVDYSGGPSEGSSDHTSFTAHQVPALFFFSGLHSDYHKPSDTWEKIDAPGAAKILGLVADLVTVLRDESDRPGFLKVAPNPHGGGDSSNPGPVSGYGPYFGSVPDFAEGIQGVKFADVRENSPAAKAGLKAGDILVEFDGKPIGNLYDFTYALRGKKPGDEVTVKVMRDGKPVTAQCTLSRRE
jgi:hypothetical protein